MENEEGKEGKKIYQIFTGLTEEEFYTYCYPIFSADYEELICKEVVEKLFLEVVILKKRITANYSAEILEEKNFKLSDGVVIKTIEEEKVMDWINKTKDMAEMTLQTKELEVYRELIPKILNGGTNVNTITSPKKDFMI